MILGKDWIFIHNFKTGGTSIQDILKDYGKLNPAPFHNHMTPDVIKTHLPDYDQFFSFAIIRNPWTRIVSYFHNYKCYEKMGFRPFIEKICQNPEKHGQYPFLQDVMFKGSFDHLQDSFNWFCKFIGIPQKDLPHRLKSPHRDWTAYYTEETAQMVQKAFKKDFQIYYGVTK